MVTITISNSYSAIKGLSADQEKALRKKLSYVIGGSGAYFSKYGPKRGSLLGKKGDFPTGLIHRVLDFVTSNDIIVEVIDTRKKPNAAIP